MTGAEGGGGASAGAGIILFTLWYVAIAVNYFIAPLFDFRCSKCKCGVCPAYSSSNCSIPEEASSPKVTHPKSHSIQFVPIKSVSPTEILGITDVHKVAHEPDFDVEEPLEEPAEPAVEEPNFEVTSDE